MNNEQQFMQAVSELKDLARLQNNVLSTEQVEEFLFGMEIQNTQKELIFDYLKSNNIGIDTKMEDSEFLSKEEINYLELYLEELEQLEKITDGIKEAVTLSAMAGDRSAKSKLIEIYLPKVVEVAKLYAGQGIYLEDLIGEGNVAVTMGVEMLGCLEHPSEAEGMLGKMIMDAMEELIGESVDAREADQKIVSMVNKVAELSEELATSIQRKVTIEELVGETDLTEEEVLEAIRISGENIEFIELEEN